MGRYSLSIPPLAQSVEEKKNKTVVNLVHSLFPFVSPWRSVILLNGSTDKVDVFNGTYLFSSIDKVGGDRTVCIYRIHQEIKRDKTIFTVPDTL